MKFIVPIAVMMAFAPISARAGERVGDAALGALSGAVVLGPVGLVAGAIVGYTAGPSIAQSWRNSRHHPRRTTRATKGPERIATRQRVPASEEKPAAGSVSPQQSGKGVGGPPPQGLE